MSQNEVVIFTGRSTRILIDEIIANVRARGIQLEWHARLLSERDAPTEWTSGYFTPPGASRPEVSVTNEALTDSDREDLLPVYTKWGLAPSLSSIFEAASMKYEATGTGSADAERDRLLAAVSLAIAELGDGLILERGTKTFYDVAAFRTRTSI